MNDMYTYDDLARYFAAVYKFAVHDHPPSDPVYGIIRERMHNYNHWHTTYEPVVKRN